MPLAIGRLLVLHAYGPWCLYIVIVVSPSLCHCAVRVSLMCDFTWCWIAPGARASADTILRIRPFIYVLPLRTRSVNSRAQSPFGLQIIYESLCSSYFRLVFAVVFLCVK